MVFEIFKKPKKILTENEENTFEQNLVWICAMERSGTTWLGRELLSHGTHYIHEPNITAHLGLATGLPDRKVVRRFDLLKDVKSYFFSKEFQPIWTYFLRKLILNRFYAQLNSLNKKVIIKEAAVVDASDIISSCLPNSKLIILFRDGRDVVDSGTDGREQGGWMTQQLNTKPMDKNHRSNFIIMQSKRWVILTENLLKTSKIHKKDLVHVVKYEDLLSDTLNELEKIYKFLQVEITKEELENLVTKFSYENIPTEKKGKGKFVRFAAPGKWRQSFSDEEKKIMNETMSDTLKKLNYES